MDIDSIQLTKFVPSGNGRMITNAGKAKSKGIELSTQANLGKGFSATINYGYAHAIFTNYIDSVAMNGSFQQVDYKGKYAPYAPQQTLCLGGSYVHLFKHAFIDQFMANAQFLGAGKIYWNEANTLSQKFYTLVNAKVGVRKGDIGLDVWAKNLFNTSYNAFYFESFGNSFFQKGNPLQCGMTLKLEL
jgi:outer membrane receptor protein involved in Fe transport